jgi:hypothetical protein
MKDQEHNQGDLEDLNVKIEKKLVEDLKLMSDNSGIPVEDLVAVAVKRFSASHADYMKIKLDFP